MIAAFICLIREYSFTKDLLIHCHFNEILAVGISNHSARAAQLLTSLSTSVSKFSIEYPLSG